MIPSPQSGLQKSVANGCKCFSRPNSELRLQWKGWGDVNQRRLEASSYQALWEEMGGKILIAGIIDYTVSNHTCKRNKEKITILIWNLPETAGGQITHEISMPKMLCSKLKQWHRSIQAAKLSVSVKFFYISVLCFAPVLPKDVFFPHVAFFPFWHKTETFMAGFSMVTNHAFRAWDFSSESSPSSKQTVRTTLFQRTDKMAGESREPGT